MPESTLILTAAAMQRALTRIAHEIAERNEAGSEVVLVGIQRGGVPLAQALGLAPGRRSGVTPFRPAAWTSACTATTWISASRPTSSPPSSRST